MRCRRFLPLLVHDWDSAHQPSLKPFFDVDSTHTSQRAHKSYPAMPQSLPNELETKEFDVNLPGSEMTVWACAELLSLGDKASIW